MNLQQKQILRTILTLVLTFSVLFGAVPAYADDISDLEDRTEDLQTQLKDIDQELLSISNEIADTESQIERTNEELLRLQDSLAISRQNEARQYEDMKNRIKFIYENNTTSLLGILFSTENLSDFLNAADFIQSISQYDQEKLNQLQEVKSGIETQEADLRAGQDNLLVLQDQLETQKAELTAKAEETSTDLQKFQQLLKTLREEEARKAAEKAESASNITTNPSSTTSSGTSSGNYSDIFNYPTSGGVLTPQKGVVYYNGHRETYYSQKVLPGGGLNIPGRHVASDGTIRDIDGYICVASSDLPWGTLVETSLGMGKVYDSGCASGTIDIYTDW